VVVVVGLGGGAFLAFVHSKVCTLCDFGHLKFYISIVCCILFVFTTYSISNFTIFKSKMIYLFNKKAAQNTIRGQPKQSTFPWPLFGSLLTVSIVEPASKTNLATESANNGNLYNS
jgi:Na+/alanine symporter